MLKECRSRNYYRVEVGNNLNPNCLKRSIIFSISQQIRNYLIMLPF